MSGTGRTWHRFIWPANAPPGKRATSSNTLAPLFLFWSYAHNHPS
jgi:hypothetical protein